MKVIINLGKGNLYDGCNNVVVQVLDSQGNYQRQLSGSLPPAPQLAELHQQWQSGYSAFYQDRVLRIGLLQGEGLRYSDRDFSQVCELIPLQFNEWLQSSQFSTIERALRTDLAKTEPIKLIITASETQLQQLPWSLWYLLDDYPQAEIAFSTPNWQEIKQHPKSGQTVRILAILGNSEGIDTQEDLKPLANLPDTELTVLKQPQLSELNDYLWQAEGWDIFLFSGHSYSKLQTGYIYLNKSEKISIAQLKHSLRKAIANGLQIAIFNSCEGMGLAIELADLSLPYTIVMSEPVPDKIAQLFLKYFLKAFAGGKTFTLAAKEARQKLAGWETEFVCASWLPAIWQNPTIEGLTWQNLYDQKSQIKLESKSQQIKQTLFSSLAISGLIMLLRSLSWLEPSELWAYDRLVQQRPPENIDPRIVVVEITDEEINSDRYPLSDRVLVEAIELLNQHQPAAIGLDIHRPYDRGEGYQDLIQLFRQHDRIFPVCAYSSDRSSYAPPQGLSETQLTQQMGFSDLLIDDLRSSTTSSQIETTTPDIPQNPTPKVRRQLLSYDPSLAASTSKCLTPYSLSFQLAFEYLHQAGVKPIRVNERQQWQFGNVVLQEMSPRFGAYQTKTGNSSQIMLNYRSGQPGKRVTLTELQSGKIEPQLITNRIVLIGYSAAIAGDYFNTPYGIIPGVWIHAHQTSQILSAVRDKRSLVTALPQWGDWLLIFMVSMLMGTILVMLTRKPPIYYAIACGISIVFVDRICLLMLVKGLWLPSFPLILSLLLITTVIVMNQRSHYLKQALNY